MPAVDARILSARQSLFRAASREFRFGDGCALGPAIRDVRAGGAPHSADTLRYVLYLESLEPASVQSEEWRSVRLPRASPDLSRDARSSEAAASFRDRALGSERCVVRMGSLERDASGPG